MADMTLPILSIIERFNYLISFIYMGAHVELFGSYATGLALKESDIDLVVIDAPINCRRSMQEAILQISEMLR